MAASSKRVAGRVMSIIGIGLFALSVAWLVSNGSSPNFLPVRHKDLFLEAGPIQLSLSLTNSRIAYSVLTSSVLLIACGRFLIRRDGSTR
jgi:hypothetical protein